MLTVRYNPQTFPRVSAHADQETLRGHSYGDFIRPKTPDLALIARLARVNGDALVSLYMPTHMKGAEINQDRIRLKNAIAEVDKWLESLDWKPRQRSEHLEEVSAFLDDQEFWQYQGRGLAVFIDDQAGATPVTLFGPVEDRATVGPGFHLRPAIPSIEMTELPVLVLTQQGVRLYRATRSEAYLVEADLPASFDDVNWFVDREKQRQQHADSAGSKRSRHGHDPSDSESEDLDRFLRAVSAGLPASDPMGPLVVLGDDRLVARFASLHDHEIASPSNSVLFDVDNVEAVHEKATVVVEDHEAAARENQLALAGEQLGTGEAVTDLTEGLIAAVSGRVSHLVIHREASPIWGSFDPSTLGVTTRDEQEVLDVDLLDRLVVHTMINGAAVTTTETPIDGYVFVATTRF